MYGDRVNAAFTQIPEHNCFNENKMVFPGSLVNDNNYGNIEFL